MNTVINKYLVFGFLKTILNMILIFTALSILLTLFEEIEFFKNLDVGLILPISLTFLFIPNLVIELMPFIIFLSSMWFFVHIKNNKDLLSLKVFGYSNLKIIFILAITAFIFGLFIIFAVNPITSSMIKYYEKTKSQYSKDIDHLVSINKNGVWIKEFNENNLRIARGEKIQGDYLLNSTIYVLNEEYNIVERLYSDKIDISEKTWKFEEVLIYSLEDKFDKKIVKNYSLESSFNAEKLNNLFKNLNTVSFISLILEYDQLIEKGYTKKALDERFNLFISLPLFLFIMVVLSSIFTVGSISKTQNLYYVFISIIACVIIFYFKDLSIALGQTNRIPQILSVWSPILAISLFCSIGIIQVNEK